MKLRRLNNEGLESFELWLSSGAAGKAPIELLKSNATSDLIAGDVQVSSGAFSNRYEFGKYLVSLLAPLSDSTITNDRFLWSSLALFWFDQLCPLLFNGTRKLDQSYRYVLSEDYRHFYRHLVRSPWQLVRDHGENARFLLLAVADGPQPLKRHGEILEQLGGRQSLLRSQPLIAEASALYSDPNTGRPKKGVAGSGRGSVRRLALVLRQLDLTFDVEAMPSGGLQVILPTEFDRWKPPLQV